MFECCFERVRGYWPDGDCTCPVVLGICCGSEGRTGESISAKNMSTSC